MINKCIYFDNNATTKTDPLVLESMLPFFSESFGNASSSLHPYGWAAKVAVEKGIAQLAAMLGCREDELVITSGATESINLALFGLFECYQAKGRHIISLKSEHKAVLDSLKALEERGALITLLDVDPEGRLDLESLKNSIRKETILVCAMAANNETGVIQDMEGISDLCRENNLIFFSDATQFAGKMRCKVKELGIHALALSAHKFYGPKGVGALYISKHSPRLNLQAQMHGGGHQDGRRAGTLNVPGIVGMGKAAELAEEKFWEDSAQISVLRNYFEHQLLEIPGLRINGGTRQRLYNTSNICFPHSPDIKKLISRFAFSSGSACSSANAEPSHVLKAMGLSDTDIKNSFRFSFGRFNSKEEVTELVNYLLEQFTGKTVKGS